SVTHRTQPSAIVVRPTISHYPHYPLAFGSGGGFGTLNRAVLSPVSDSLSASSASGPHRLPPRTKLRERSAEGGNEPLPSTSPGKVPDLTPSASDSHRGCGG